MHNVLLDNYKLIYIYIASRMCDLYTCILGQGPRSHALAFT